MTKTKDITSGLEAWASIASMPVQQLNTFPDKPENLDEALPAVLCDITRRRRVQADSDMQEFQYEQTSLRIWTARLTIMVQPGDSWANQTLLYDLTDELEQSLIRDPTLGGHVEYAVPQAEVEFPGEVEHPDGTVALAAFFQITVGEQAEV